jgi:hypothetical protein
MNSSWTKSGLSKKDVTDKLKIAIFEKNTQHTMIYAAEIICSGHSTALIQICIELWCKFYILSTEIPALILESIELLENINQKEVYKYSNIRNTIIKLCFVICMTDKNQLEFYISKINKNSFTLLKPESELNKFYNNIIEDIASYIEKDSIIYFGTLLQKFYRKDYHSFNKVLSYLIDTYLKKIDLKKDCEVIHLSLTKNYIWIFIKMLKYIYEPSCLRQVRSAHGYNKYVSETNGALAPSVYNNYIKIFEFNLIKYDIMNRINIIYLLFNLVIDNKILYNMSNQLQFQHNIILNEINNIFDKLIIHYQLPTKNKEITSQKSKKNNKNKTTSLEEYYENNTNEYQNQNQMPSNERERRSEKPDSSGEEPSDTDYLYTITYVDKKKLKKKEDNLNIPRFYPIKTIDVADINENKLIINVSKLI